MKNKKLCVIIGIVALIIAFVGYKIFLLYYFNRSDEFYKKIYNEITDISITRDVSNQNEQVGNLKFYLPSELGMEEKDSSKGQKLYSKYDSAGNQVGQLVIGLADYNTLEDVKQSIRFMDYEKLAKKYNINDEVDLYRYYYEHQDEKSNIFWSNSHIKMNGFVKSYMILASVGGSTCDVYFLNQDMKGYMIDCNNNLYRAFLVYENENYIVNYSGKENATISYQDFMKILESISFE